MIVELRDFLYSSPTAALQSLFIQRQTNKELAYKNTAAIMFEDKDTTTNTSVILL